MNYEKRLKINNATNLLINKMWGNPARLCNLHRNNRNDLCPTMTECPIFHNSRSGICISDRVSFIELRTLFSICANKYIDNVEYAFIVCDFFWWLFFFDVFPVTFFFEHLVYTHGRPESILYKSIAGRYRPVRVADGPITARNRFIKNATWVPLFIDELPLTVSGLFNNFLNSLTSFF